MAPEAVVLFALFMGLFAVVTGARITNLEKRVAELEREDAARKAMEGR